LQESIHRGAVHRIPASVSEAHNTERIDDKISTKLMGVSLRWMESIPEQNAAQIIPYSPRHPRSENRPLQSVGSIDTSFPVEEEREG